MEHHKALSTGGIDAASTTGNAASQSTMLRIPCLDIAGGMGEVNKRSHFATTLSIWFKSPAAADIEASKGAAVVVQGRGESKRHCHEA